MSGHLRSRAKRAARKYKHQVVRDQGMAQMPWRMSMVEFRRITQWRDT